MTEAYAFSTHTFERLWSWGTTEVGTDWEGIAFAHKAIIPTVFHVSNNKITKIEAKNLAETEEDWLPVYIVGGDNMAVGGSPYFLRRTNTLWTESNIKQIGTAVSLDSVRPGDLLFWESSTSPNGRSHIAVYVGNGLAVHGGFGGSAGNVVLSSMYMSGYPNPTAWRV